MSVADRSDELLDHVLDLVGGGEAEALLLVRDHALTRFASSAIHQNVAEHDASLQLRLVEDGRTGVARTNRLDPAGLAELVKRTRALARRAAPNPRTAVLPAGAERVDDETGFSEATAHASPRARAAGAEAAIRAAHGLRASGAFSSEAAMVAVGNTRGVRSRKRLTEAKLITVADAEGRSGYAQAAGADIGQIDAAAVGAEAAEKARRGENPVDVEPGAYQVVLEEYAVATILEYLSLEGFSALALEEGRSFMELGERVMGPNVTIRDDGTDPAGVPSGIDFEGVRKQRVDLIVGGVARAVVHDSATAARAGMGSTGHALPAPNPWGPLAWNLFMQPGTTPRDELVGGIERGIWVTRFHYVNIVHPKRAILTGMTKDGTFLIEDGEVTRPVRNLRFTQSVPEAFSSIEAVADTTRLLSAEYSGIWCRAPALRIAGFNFTGATAAEGHG